MIAIQTFRFLIGTKIPFSECPDLIQRFLKQNNLMSMLPLPKLSVAPALKRICKQHGYTYVKHVCECFLVQKRTRNGHYISLEIAVGPRLKGVDLMIRYVGAGFDHPIGVTIRYPQDQKALEDYLEEIFQALIAAEKEMFPLLESHYPPTPDWFLPIT